ncbi:hypothetical protein SAVIM338S_02024 [Streptomyces avidinii]
MFAHGYGRECGCGYGMSAGEHWYSSAGEEFAAEGREVRIPNFPEPFAPEAGVWPRALEAEARGAPAAGNVLVGHGLADQGLADHGLAGRGLGGVNALRRLREHDTGAEGAFAGVVVLVAPMSGEADHGALAPFFTPEFDWRRVRGAARGFRVPRAADGPVAGEAAGVHVVRRVRELGSEARVTASGEHVPSSGGSRLVLPDAVRLIRGVLEPVS